MDPHRERRLIRRCQKGDWAAFEALFHAHRERTYRLLCRLCGSQAEADDLHQEMWMRAYRGMSGFDGQARLSTWLCRIGWRAFADRQRDLQGDRRLRELPETEEQMPASDGAEPDERLEAAEASEALEEAMSSLPAEQRAALVLVCFEEMSYAQAATVQDCPTGTVAWRVAAARRKLTERMAPYLDQE